MQSWLQTQAKLRPTAPALYFKDKRWSFLALSQQVQKYANYYQHQLPANCQRVALYSENNPQMYLSILALWELGLEVQFINVRLTKPEIKAQLKAAQTAFLLTAPTNKFALVKTVSFPTKAQLKTPKVLFDQGYKADQVASIMYTSGTTGRPKGVPQTFFNHQASARATGKNMHLQSKDSWLCAVPLFHISGLSILLRSLILGLSVRLYDHYDAQQTNLALQQGHGTVISLVNKMLQELLPLVPVTGFKANFKYVLLGGGPVDKATLKLCEAKKLPVIQSYGMTETCSQIIALPPIFASQKIGSSGLPLAQAQIKIKHPNQQGVGEILLKGPMVVTQYLDNMDGERWTKEHWFKTGDVGYLDKAGFLYVKSRLKDLIISGGENIYPEEIETVLKKYPGIKEAVVIGKPDEKWGARPVAYLLAEQEINLISLKAFLAKSLAKYKLPNHYYFVSKIPKTASGKPLKRIFTTVNGQQYLKKA